MSTCEPKKMLLPEKEIVDSVLLEMLISDLQSPRMVASESFVELMKALNPDYVLPDYQTVSQVMIPSLYQRCFNKCKDFVKQNKTSSLCLTTDCWTSIDNERFLALTMHFIDSNFIIRRFLLSSFMFSEDDINDYLPENLKYVFEKWELNLNNISLLIVSNNAANFETTVGELGVEYLDCFAHTLNLIVQDALKLINPVLDKVRKTVLHFKTNPDAKAELIKFQEDSGVTSPQKLKLDVASRWNSTYIMLKRFVKLEVAINSMDTPLPKLEQEESSLIKDMVDILLPFESVTTSVNENEYIPASLVIVFSSSLLDDLNKLISKQLRSDFSKVIINALKTGIQTHFKDIEFNRILAANTFLDPRFKQLPFQSPAASKNILEIIEELVEKNISSELKIKENLCTSCESKESELKKAKSLNNRAMNEIELYLKQDVLDKDENPLVWWKNHQDIYPNLSFLFKDMFALATSLPCKRLFSKAGELLNEQREILDYEEMEEIIFLNANYAFSKEQT